MIGGTVIENALVRQNETDRLLRRLWCMEGNDECAVYAEPDDAAEVRTGDRIWWQAGKIMWSREGEFRDRVFPKVGYSFTPPGEPSDTEVRS